MLPCSYESTVKLSDSLVLDARLAGQASSARSPDRSSSGRGSAGPSNCCSRAPRCLRCAGPGPLILSRPASNQSILRGTQARGEFSPGSTVSALRAAPGHPRPADPHRGRRQTDRGTLREPRVSTGQGPGQKLSLPLDCRPLIVALAGPTARGRRPSITLIWKRAACVSSTRTSLLSNSRCTPMRPPEQSRQCATSWSGSGRVSFSKRSFQTRWGQAGLPETGSRAGYTVVLCFIGVSRPEVSEERVAMRVSQGGHDVPPEKLTARFPRTLANLRNAIRELPHVWVFDNDDLRRPFRQVAVFESGHQVSLRKPVPAWLRPLLPS